VNSEEPQDLEKLSEEQLADLYCRLNRGQIKVGPGNLTPLQIMEWIEGKIGEKACLRAWNEEMSDEDFEIFWKAHEAGEGTPEDAAYEKRLEKRVEDDEKM